VFACGPWIGKLFQQTIGNLVQATKQEIFFFGPPERDSRFTDADLPVWGDHGERFFYGIPGSDGRGFKVADDTRGESFDPTFGERVVSQETLQRVRAYIDFRFSAMKGAPLVETRVCQYEQTPDSDFIVDRHPRMDNFWILGGGSGHGFKHGPALGEMMAKLVLKGGEVDKRWRLARFSGARPF
jgi:sarcosine oxidase